MPCGTPDACCGGVGWWSSCSPRMTTRHVSPSRTTAAERELAVCVVEKGSEVGAHILSGAVFEPRALDELIPDWREQGAPLLTPAIEDRFLLLTARRAWHLPTPPQMRLVA